MLIILHIYTIDTLCMNVILQCNEFLVTVLLIFCDSLPQIYNCLASNWTCSTILLHRKHALEPASEPLVHKKMRCTKRFASGGLFALVRPDTVGSIALHHAS